MLKNDFYKILIATVLNAATFAAAAFATTIVRMDLATLAHSAELIVRARCVNTESRWESSSLWTFDDFEVLETFKGATPQTLRVRLPGGRSGHMQVNVEGVPRFAAGEEVVLFVERTSAGDFGVTSWAQGTFRIHRAGTGDVRVTQDTSRFAVFDPRTHQFVLEGIRNITLNEFRASLSVALTAPGRTSEEKPR